MQISIVDVFAENPLEGNQLAVVRGAGDLTGAQMQAIAREMNFSETTFVVSETKAHAQVRIFTASSELPFAGHPTLGTAWVITGGVGACFLELRVGVVPVEFIEDIGWIIPPPTHFGPELSIADAARLLRLPESQISPNFPIRRAEVGPKFVLVGVVDRTALRECRVDEDVMFELLGAPPSTPAIYVFTPDAHSPGGDFASRTFFHAGSLREDPATGSANSAFAAYLREHRGPGSGFDVVVDQGVEMLRPSRLYLRIDPPGTDAPVRVGGKVQPVLTGEFAAAVRKLLG